MDHLTLDIQDLSCGYGDHVVVDGFTASVRAGSVLCLLGPNGVGKTTLFRTVLGLLAPKRGRILVGAKDVAAMSSTQVARLLGYVPQSAQTPFAFRVLDVVVMGRTAHLGIFGRPRDKDMDLAYDALDRLSAAHLADASFTELSGGERQLVMIARALVQEPAFIMLDEPTSSLDFGNQVRVLQQIVQLARSGIGVVMTTHAPDHVFLCDAEVVLLTSSTTYVTGRADDVLTESALSSAYGVDVRITHSDVDGVPIRHCSPVMPRDPSSGTPATGRAPPATPG